VRDIKVLSSGQTDTISAEDDTADASPSRARPEHFLQGNTPVEEFLRGPVDTLHWAKISSRCPRWSSRGMMCQPVARAGPCKRHSSVALQPSTHSGIRPSPPILPSSIHLDQEVAM
jgi:hypothetical protein